MTFELEEPTKTRVLDVRVLSKKDRKPDEDAGLQFLLQATLPWSQLAMFDGFLPGLLYRKATAAKQGSIEGMEPAELTEAGKHLPRVKWDYEQTGCDVLMDRGIGGKSNLDLHDCRVHRVSFQPKPAGSVSVQWTVDAPALSDATRGKLTALKGTDVYLQQWGPEVADDAQQDIEQSAAPKPAPAPKASAKPEPLTPEQALAAAFKEPEKKAGPKVTTKKAGKSTVKYRSPNTGETWSGLGLQPKWLKVALASGKKITDFEVSKQPAPAAQQPKGALSPAAAWPFPTGQH
jgi:hypothetical protein